MPGEAADTPSLGSPAPPAREDTTTATATPRVGSAVALLDALVVRPHGPRSGYAREQFGSAWLDVDRNGCDTRNDILRRDLADATFKPGARECGVLSGALDDPYTGRRIHFVHGGGPGVDVDHVVALGNAWLTGAARWQLQQRVALANDPLNLLAVDATSNRAKGDRDAASWLPPNRAYHCAYVARQIAVKHRYDLSITASERDAMLGALKACPDEPAPVAHAPTIAPSPANDPPPAAEPAAPAPEPRSSQKPPDPDYGTCKEAKARGAGPYVRDRDPEYAYYRDRDGDGVVCE